MPSIFSIFISVISNFINPHSATEYDIEKIRQEIKPPTSTDSNYENMLRYEYTMQLIQNAEKAFKLPNKQQACEYLEEANRISGYMGRIQELLQECK